MVAAKGMGVHTISALGVTDGGFGFGNRGPHPLSAPFLGVLGLSAPKEQRVPRRPMPCQIRRLVRSERRETREDLLSESLRHMNSHSSKKLAIRVS